MVFNNLVITEYKIFLSWDFNLLQIHSIALGHDNSGIFFLLKVFLERGEEILVNEP